jgi:hypothetical protein
MVPTVYPTAMFDDLDVFMLEFLEHNKEITAGVASYGDAANYAEVWEWGNVRQTKKGPKTVLGINPDGEEVWLSIQAPSGYIRISEEVYWFILKDELGKVKFKGNTAKEITEELETAAKKAMKRIAKVVGENAPVDRGDLSKSFRAVDPGDSLLDVTDNDMEKVLTIGEDE